MTSATNAGITKTKALMLSTVNYLKETPIVPKKKRRAVKSPPNKLKISFFIFIFLLVTA